MFRLADILQIVAVTPSVVIFLFLLYVSQMFGYFCLHFCFFLASFLAKCVCVFFFFRHCVQLYQYDGNPSLGILGFVLFSKNYPVLFNSYSNITKVFQSWLWRISRRSINSVVFTQYYTVVQKNTTDITRLCSLFIADSEM